MLLEVPAPPIAGITLRPVAPSDEAFLRALYRETREAELALTPWSPAQKQAFADDQFRLQDLSYRTNYPGAALLVIERDAKVIGRLYLHATPGELGLMDIALEAGERNRGLGTAMMRWLQDWAARDARAIALYVEQFNPARRFYLRLGFVEMAQEGIYLRMRWTPAALRGG